ncbi:MAG TPA: hypothetical protein VFL57_00960 [Bryobacteraceae bacterium]|nr:hypothetical protein [Bryobacteraceae bacterium]
MDVVIIPPEQLGGIYADNRDWGRQYAAADPQNRRVVQMSDATAQAAVDATRAAAALASPGGRVIYATGHGAGSDRDGHAGNADFAPHRQLRVTQFVAFYDVSTAYPRSVREMEAALPRRRSRGAIRRWCDEYIEDECLLSVQQLRDRSRVQPFYDQLAAVFHAQPVAVVILLTCNVGTATDFLDELSTDLGVRVRAYTRRVMSGRPGGRGTPVRMFLEGDAEGQGTNVPAAETQLMPNARARADFNVGVVRTRGAGTLPRPPVVPPLPRGTRAHP